MSVALVTTTIHVPKLLNDYCANARLFKHEDITVIVIGDKKTPSGVGEFCQQLQRQWGYDVEFFDLDSQHRFLAAYGALRDYLPYNSLQRRNIGLLRAYLTGAKTIITIDDDNFVEMNDDYFARHSIVGTEREMKVVSSSSGWHNICEMLVEEHNLPFYPRGWPLHKRWIKSETRIESKKGKAVVNAGLWLEAPDIDALTWLDLPIRTLAYRPEYPDGVALLPGTWAPFNSQNTALAAEVIPAYFLSPHIGRYDDIWASYIVKKIADHLGHYIHFGPPVVRQQRNPHNYFKDFDLERLGLETTSQFVEALQSSTLSSSSYGECFAETVAWLDEHKNDIWNQNSRDSIDRMLMGMRLWQEAYAAVPVSSL